VQQHPDKYHFNLTDTQLSSVVTDLMIKEYQNSHYISTIDKYK